MGHGGGNNMHTLGMWFNFLFSAGLITYFVVRMGATLRAQEAQNGQGIQRCLRDQGGDLHRLLVLATVRAALRTVRVATRRT